MIYVNKVTKKYGKTIANNQITMKVEAGELAVLLGPNGAGKSTLIKSICGLLRFDGEITIFGHENHSLEAKAILAYIPEIPAMYMMLTVYEHIQFIAKAYKLTDWESRAEELLTRFELADKKKKLGKELSKGMQQKVSICCALLPTPKAIIFDEPFVGLDPHAIRELKSLLRELKDKGSSIIVSTHMIESMEENWDTTYIMKNGEIMRTCRRDEIDSGKIPDSADGSSTNSLEQLYFSITEGDDVKGDAKS